jgi:hypothetical protein
MWYKLVINLESRFITGILPPRTLTFEVYNSNLFPKVKNSFNNMHNHQYSLYKLIGLH